MALPISPQSGRLALLASLRPANAVSRSRTATVGETQSYDAARSRTQSSFHLGKYRSQRHSERSFVSSCSNLCGVPVSRLDRNHSIIDLTLLKKMVVVKNVGRCSGALLYAHHRIWQGAIDGGEDGSDIDLNRLPLRVRSTFQESRCS